MNCKDKCVCENCEKAMRAMWDYTCKETCERVKPDETCNKFKRGVPVGGRSK